MMMTLFFQLVSQHPVSIIIVTIIMIIMIIIIIIIIQCYK